MQQINKQPAFELGQIVATPGALAALKKAGQQRVSSSRAMSTARTAGKRLQPRARVPALVSPYRTHAGDKLWIITESNRSVTLLLPEEY